MRPRPIKNPPNPWSSQEIEWLGEPPDATLRVYEQRAHSIVVENKSPDIPFRFGVNAYRGCQHACAYCYARPSHQHLDFGAGTDFDTRIIVKTNAVELLRARFERTSWAGETICFSGNTDCYQPLEVHYRLTRGCLEVCAEYRNPTVIITKGSLIRRDLDVLQDLSQNALLKVWISMAFADDAHSRAIEPGTPVLAQRIKTIKLLAEAGIDVGVSVSPIIPGLNDADIPTVLERAADAGASAAFMTLLRLPGETRAVFEERLRLALPERASKVLNGLEEVRSGQDRGAFGQRMVGVGPRWELIRRIFETQCTRLGLNAAKSKKPERTTFRRPSAQTLLFE